MSDPRGERSLRDDSVVSTDRIVTIPNILTMLRLVLLVLFAWLVFGPRADVAAAAVLLVIGITDYLDGFIARRWSQVSRIGQILDPLVDRITIATVVISLALRGVIPWWIVAALLARELLLLALLPLLRSRGLLALPVHYLGKAATFVLFLAFPLLLAGTGTQGWQDIANITGWALLLWGVGLYWYGAVLYTEQTWRVLRTLPPRRISEGSSRTPHQGVAGA